MNKNSLFSMPGSFILGVDITEKLKNMTVKDLVRAIRAKNGEVVDLGYDFNGNGIVDNEDVLNLRKILLGFEDISLVSE